MKLHQRRADLVSPPAPREGPELSRLSDGVSRTEGLRAQEIDKYFRTDERWLPVLNGVSLEAAGQEFVSVIGPSGCGKSTLFNILAGLEPPTSGRVTLAGEDITGRLGLIGYMPQKDLLLPWKNVLDNVIVGLELLGASRREARDEARSWFPRFGLEGFERHYPATLSGGMRQRAALLRTFLARRDTLLLDEPFGALDALTRADLQEWLLDIWQSFRKTVLLVTHDVDEAIYLADRVYVMTPRPGHIQTVVDVPLPRPRRYEDTVTSAAFAAVKRDLLSALRRHPGETAQ